MSITVIFLIMAFASIVLSAGFGIATVAATESEMPILGVISGALCSVFVVTVFVGFIGTFWSLNLNSRDTHNRCVESGGYIVSINGNRQCLAEPPQILFRL